MKNIISILTERFAYSISRKSRKKKFQFFLDSLKPLSHEKIIDVGVNDLEYSATDNYLEKYYIHPENITAVAHESLNHFSAQYPEVKAVIADGTNLPFDDNTFDIGYSNAVIEHVGDYTKQQQFLFELVRVSKRGFLTTPNRFFPVEVHTRIPLLHIILSKKNFDKFLKLIGKGWATEDYMHLLSHAELQKLFENIPHCSYSIQRHRFMGFTMTFSVTWQKLL
jgi:hypothetical protein